MACTFNTTPGRTYAAERFPPTDFNRPFPRSRNGRACHPGNHADGEGTVEAEKRSSTLRRTCIFCCRRLVGVLVVCYCGLLDYGITARVTISSVYNFHSHGCHDQIKRVLCLISFVSLESIYFHCIGINLNYFYLVKFLFRSRFK